MSITDTLEFDPNHDPSNNDGALLRHIRRNVWSGERPNTWGMDEVYGRDYHAVYNITFAELVDCMPQDVMNNWLWHNWAPNDKYPQSWQEASDKLHITSDVLRDYINDRVIRRFKYRDIGYNTVAQFLERLCEEMNRKGLALLYFIARYTEALPIDPFTNGGSSSKPYTDTTTETHWDDNQNNQDTSELGHQNNAHHDNNVSNGTSANTHEDETNTDDKARQVNSDYAAAQIKNSQDYATTASDSGTLGHTITDGTSNTTTHDTSELVGTSNTTLDNTNNTHGTANNQGGHTITSNYGEQVNYMGAIDELDRYVRFQFEYRDPFEVFLEELDKHFCQLYSAGYDIGGYDEHHGYQGLL